MPAEPLTQADMDARKRAADARIAEAARRQAARQMPERIVEPDRAERFHDAAARIRAALERRREALIAAGDPRAIIAHVAQEHGLRHADIVGPCRDDRHVRARLAAIAAVASAEPHRSLPRLGRIFRRDHTTILHALRKVHGADYRHQAGGGRAR